MRNKQYLTDLVAELDFWNRLNSQLVGAEYTYPRHTYEILAARREIYSIINTVETDLDYARVMEKKDEGT